MKTKLFTKNSFLVLMMTLVLALGVQGVAEALTFGTSRSGDLATELPAPNDFDISFSVSLKGNTSIRNDDGQLVTQADDTHLIDRSGYYVNADGEYVTEAGGSTVATTTAERVKAGDDIRYHYNQEQVTITVTGANITEVGRYDITDAASHVLMETGKDGSKLSSSITLTLQAAAGAVVGITIRDSTPLEDFPSNAQPPSERAFITFTVYVVPGTSTETLSLAGDGTDGVEISNDFGEKRIDELFQVANNVPITYQVEGSGRVFIQASGDRKTRETNKLETSSSAPVYLKMNRSSNKVTVWVGGTDAKRASRSVTFINQYADPQITGGDNQSGATEGRLPDPLEVTVKDANNRVIPDGVVVGFALGTGADNGMFIPVPGTTVYVSATDTLVTAAPTTPDALTATATSAVPVPAAAIFVKTDSRGVAQTYFELGDSSGPQRVTITVNGQTYPNTFFRATAAEAGDAAKIEIESGNGQRADVDEPLEDPLVVIVKDIGGRIVAGAPVTFTTSSGELSAPEFSDPGTYTTSEAHSDRFIVVNTDRNGKASVRYNVGDLPGAKEVFAGITRNGRAITKTFNINGSGARASEPTPPAAQPTTGSLDIIVTGEGATRTVTVTATSAAGTAPTIPVALTGTALGGETRTVTSGTATEIELPTEPDDYTLIATASIVGYNPHTEIITVAGPTSLGTISITPIGTPNNGVQTFSITVVDTDRSRISGDLTVTVSGAGFTPSSVATVNGAGAVNMRLPTAAALYTLTARAEGYTSGTTQVRIAGTTQTTDTPTTTDTTTDTTPVTAEPASLQISGPATRSGTVNTEIEAPLLVRVLDADGAAVGDVRVIFRVRSGQGRLSQRGNGRAVAVQTDSQGYARTEYTPMSARSTVEGEVRGVASTVTFTITTGGGTATNTGTSDTTSGRTYQVGDKVPISLQDTLTFRGSRTLNGTSYTCVGSGECVVSYGTLVKGEIAATAVPKVQAKAYKTGEKIPISLAATLTFSGKHTLGGTVYTCVSDGECVVSYGILTKGEIEVSTVATPSAGDSPGMSDAKAVVGAANRPVMYWIAGGGLYRLAGASAEQIAARATDVAVGRDKLYWIEQTSETRGAIHHANLDGSDAAVIKTLTSVPKGVALANGKLYITNGWGKIQRMNVDGTQFETNFLTNLGAPLRIAVSGSRVYWTDGSGRVRSAPLQGTKAIQNIVTGSGTLGGIVADGSKVYWTEQTGARSGRVRAANLDGTGITNAYTVTATVHGLALDPANQQLYWTNGWGKVQRGVRGSRYQDVVTGLMTPTALAIGGANTATPMTATKPASTASEPNYDVDGSGTVDNADLFLVSLAVGTDNAQYDVNGDGTVNDKDIALVRDNRDNGAAAAPMVFGVKLTAEQVGRLQAQIDLLIVSGDRSPDALKTLVYLQQLIATARPEKTQLLANYPNPFNPETWIPYELATDTDVKITIYTSTGVVVRALHLGHQTAGYYIDRERAAYWDGRNAFGEQVASGVYFYQLETDTLSTLRKMVILK